MGSRWGYRQTSRWGAVAPPKAQPQVKPMLDPKALKGPKAAVKKYLYKYIRELERDVPVTCSSRIKAELRALQGMDWSIEGLVWWIERNEADIGAEKVRNEQRKKIIRARAERRKRHNAARKRVRASKRDRSAH